MYAKTRVPAAYYLTVAQMKGQEGEARLLIGCFAMRSQHLTTQHQEIRCNAAGCLAAQSCSPGIGETEADSLVYAKLSDYAWLRMLSTQSLNKHICNICTAPICVAMQLAVPDRTA